MITWLASGDFAQNAHYRFASRIGGTSTSPYDELNVASWVGDSPDAVKNNLNKLQQELEIPIKSMRPNHGIAVQDVFGDENELMLADILVTTQSKVGLLAPSADCVSLFASSSKIHFLMAAHIGWRGAAANISYKLIKISEMYGVLPDDLEIVLGPAICGWCYPVSLEVHDLVTTHLPEASMRSSTFVGIDLRIGLTRYFSEFGIKVVNNQPCTYESHELYSYRRNSITGRQAAIAWLN